MFIVLNKCKGCIRVWSIFFKLPPGSCTVSPIKNVAIIAIFVVGILEGRRCLFLGIILDGMEWEEHIIWVVVSNIFLFSSLFGEDSQFD